MTEEIDENWVVLPSDAASTLPSPDEAEDHLVIFTRKFNEKIDEKRNQEYENEKTARSKAEEEYANWKNQRNIRLKAKMDSNRQEETLFVSTLHTETNCLKVWDNVSKLINTQLTDSVEYKGPDMSRMKKLIIDLKNSPIIIKDEVEEVKKWNSNPLNSPDHYSNSISKISISDPSPILSSYAPAVNPLVSSKKNLNVRSINEELDSELSQQTEVISDAASHEVKILEDTE